MASSKSSMKQLRTNALRNAPLYDSIRRAKENEARVLKKEVDEVDAMRKRVQESGERFMEQRNACMAMCKESDDEIAAEWALQ